ncbi:MAG: universal stress protein [Chloroflexota bacterium]
MVTAELPKYTVILNPTDGSTASRAATLHAVYLAKLSGAKLLPLFVVDQAAARMAGVNVRQVIHQATLKGQAALSSIKALAASNGVVAEEMLLEAEPAPTIVRIARDQDASLIVMGTTAYSDIDRLLARATSTSREVLESAPCPVLIVGAG